MEYELIGERLGYSFSKEIHEKLSPCSYELREIAREDLDNFLKQKEFLGINVTIPYKEAVLPYLDEIAPEARSIGAVNTIVRDGDRLRGFNTDYYGFLALAEKAGIDFAGREVLILGAGGAAKTVHAVATDRGAARITHAVRTPKAPGQVGLGELKPGSGYEIIVNCTPVGTHPRDEESPVDLGLFPRLKGVLDLVYNPLRTRLVLDAQERGIPAEGGLYMLVAQAVQARRFFDASLDTDRCPAEPPASTWAPSAAADKLSAQRMTPDARMDEAHCRRQPAGPDSVSTLFNDILGSKRNLVLIGMPSSGKTTLGQALADRSARPFFDTDRLIVEKAGKPIPRIFAEDGEPAFRQIEAEVIRDLSQRNGLVIATGGGAILNPDNVRRLRHNGLICRIDRDLERLSPSSDRPLASDLEKMRALYQKRREAYLRATDCRIDNNGPLEDALAQLQALI